MRLRPRRSALHEQAEPQLPLRANTCLRVTLRATRDCARAPAAGCPRRTARRTRRHSTSTANDCWPLLALAVSPDSRGIRAKRQAPGLRWGPIRLPNAASKQSAGIDVSANVPTHPKRTCLRSGAAGPSRSAKRSRRCTARRGGWTRRPRAAFLGVARLRCRATLVLPLWPAGALRD
jgi:hypothetical protein